MEKKYQIVAGIFMAAMLFLGGSAQAEKYCLKAASRIRGSEIRTRLIRRVIQDGEACPRRYREILSSSDVIGPAGATGPAGPAGPFPTVLPSQVSMIGAWNVAGGADGLIIPEQAAATISFPFPLETAPTPEWNEGSPTANCPGTAQEPVAAPGYLCIYIGVMINVVSYEATDPGSWASGIVGKTGAALYFNRDSSAVGFWARGTWAVTAP